MKMLIGDGPPPLSTLSAVSNTGEFCPSRTLGAVIDPFGISAIVGSAANVFGTIEQAKAAKRQSQAEIAAVKAQNVSNARDFAQANADAQVAPARRIRNEQLLALYGIAGMAAVISLLFLVNTMKKGD